MPDTAQSRAIALQGGSLASGPDGHIASLSPASLTLDFDEHRTLPSRFGRRFRLTAQGSLSRELISVISATDSPNKSVFLRG